MCLINESGRHKIRKQSCLLADVTIKSEYTNKVKRRIANIFIWIASANDVIIFMILKWMLLIKIQGVL